MVLTGITTQDVNENNFNPGDGVFGTLEFTLTTQVQYPFAIVGPVITREDDSPHNDMRAYIGNGTDSDENHASKIEFVNFQHMGKCRDYGPSDMCVQDFKVKITPNNTEDPCSVAGLYTFEFWATCLADADMKHDNLGCSIDDVGQPTETDKSKRRTSNAYFTQVIRIDHQDFCPTIMDEIKVVGDFIVYHDEEFTEAIATGTDSNVFTNDILYFEATYRTNSNKAPQEGFDTEGHNDSGDKYIDYVRAQKIFLDVTIGEDRDGNPTEWQPSGATWNSDDWESNFRYSLGGERIPGDSVGLDDDGGLTVTTSGNGKSKTVYNIVLCQVDYLNAVDIVEDEKPTDCFTAPKDIAVDYLDFNKVMFSKGQREDPDGVENKIEENEIAFKLRLDERVIPISPPLDYSFLYATVQAEVYYKGNLQATRRRLLQSVSNNAFTGQRSQNSILQTNQFTVNRRKTLERCNVWEEQLEGTIMLGLTFPEDVVLPKMSTAPTFARDLTMELSSYLSITQSMEVVRVDVSGKTLYSKYMMGQRRLQQDLSKQGELVTVFIDFKTAGQLYAGKVMNVVQDHLIKRDSDIHTEIQTFNVGSVVSMEVIGCNKKFEDNLGSGRDSKLQSSSRQNTSLFVFLVATVSTLFL